MNEKFYELKKEKQDLMINGAMEIFAKYGYRKASTDDMVKACGVSKGLWFHYFENKKGLYEFVAVYGVKYAVMEYENMRIDNMDIYETIKCFERTKIILMEKYPFIPLLILSVLEERDEEVVNTANYLRDLYRDCLVKILEKKDMLNLLVDDRMVRLSYMVDSTFRRLLKNCYLEPAFRKEYYLSECYAYLDNIQNILTDIK